MKITEMKEIVDRLQMLLDDPQEGLFTWHQFLGESMDKLVKGWLGEHHAEAIEALLWSVLAGSVDYNDRVPRGFGNWQGWEEACFNMLEMLPETPLRQAAKAMLAAEAEYRGESAKEWNRDELHAARRPFVDELRKALRGQK